MAVLRNVTTGKIVAGNVERADGVWRRLTGFIPYNEIGPDDGLWFDRCSAIHTFGMRRPIDAVFLDKNRRIVRIRRSIPCCRIICPAPERTPSSN